MKIKFSDILIKINNNDKATAEVTYSNTYKGLGRPGEVKGMRTGPSESWNPVREGLRHSARLVLPHGNAGPTLPDLLTF